LGVTSPEQEPRDATRGGAEGGRVGPSIDDVPKLPFAKGLRLSWRETIRVATVAAMLVVVVVTRQSCSDAVSQFVTSFDDSSPPADQMPKPGKLERITPTASPAEQKAAVDRAREQSP
jgi:hypothetical protein